jgi:hypothetical protein
MNAQMNMQCEDVLHVDAAAEVGTRRNCGFTTGTTSSNEEKSEIGDHLIKRTRKMMKHTPGKKNLREIQRVRDELADVRRRAAVTDYRNTQEIERLQAENEKLNRQVQVLTGKVTLLQHEIRRKDTEYARIKEHLLRSLETKSTAGTGVNQMKIPATFELSGAISKAGLTMSSVIENPDAQAMDEVRKSSAFQELGELVRKGLVSSSDKLKRENVELKRVLMKFCKEIVNSIVVAHENMLNRCRITEDDRPQGASLPGDQDGNEPATDGFAEKQKEMYGRVFEDIDFIKMNDAVVNMCRCSSTGDTVTEGNESFDAVLENVRMLQSIVYRLTSHDFLKDALSYLKANSIGKTQEMPQILVTDMTAREAMPKATPPPQQVEGSTQQRHRLATPSSNPNRKSTLQTAQILGQASYSDIKKRLDFDLD